MLVSIKIKWMWDVLCDRAYYYDIVGDSKCLGL